MPLGRVVPAHLPAFARGEGSRATGGCKFPEVALHGFARDL